MNIFYLDNDPKICAQYHCDKHVVKMIVETAQILSVAHRSTGSEAPYKATHQKHPCCIRASSSLDNYNWLVNLGLELCNEYNNRYKKNHKTLEILNRLNINKPNIKSNGFTEPPKCMPDDSKLEGTIDSYKNFYRIHKSSFAVWKYTYTPNWY